MNAKLDQNDGLFNREETIEDVRDERDYLLRKCRVYENFMRSERLMAAVKVGYIHEDWCAMLRLINQIDLDWQIVAAGCENCKPSLVAANG